MWWLLFLVVAQAAPRDEGCRALCVRDGYDGGHAVKKGCVCYVLKDDYEDFLRSRINIGIVDQGFKVRVQLKNEDGFEE